MPIKGFDYNALVAQIVKNIDEVFKQPNSDAVPEGVTEKDKAVIIKVASNFCMSAGKSLAEDPNVNLSPEEGIFILNAISEYIFHVYIDMILGKIPEDSRQSILIAVIGDIFNTAKVGFIKKLPENNIIDILNNKYPQLYAIELQKLVKKGLLPPDRYEEAIKISNRVAYTQKEEDKANVEKMQNTSAPPTAPNEKKVLKFAALAILLKKLPQDKAQEILSSFDKDDAVHLANYMRMADLESKIDSSLILKSLAEIKQIIPEPENINVEKLLKRYKKTLKTAKIDVLSEIAMNERENVKDFILDTGFPAANYFSPMVIQSLVNSIEEKLNDN